MSDPVRAQYEALPYPPRDPQDEKKRLIAGSPSRVVEIAHFIYGGRLDLARPFRALVAGGGTGDATIMLAQQLADAKADAEIVYLDWSEASRAIAEARAKVRGLSNIRFVNASLLDYAQLGLGRFDYIDCCGVLHHLPDPPGALAALVASLNDEGGMGMMLYGRLGRTGVYPAQDMLRMLLDGRDDTATRVTVARRLLAQLPATNWLKRNPHVTDHITDGDSGVFDLLLHARDRAYDMHELNGLIAGAGLRLAGLTPPAAYEPSTYLSDATLLRRLENLPLLERAAFAENLAGSLMTHVFYAVRSGNKVAPPAPDDPDSIPVFCEPAQAELARRSQAGGVLNVPNWSAKLPLPSLAPAIAAQIDSRRTLREIHAALKALRSDLGWEAFVAQFRLFFNTFHGVGHLMLRK